MKKFFKTVAIVTVFSAFERLLGFLYRIYLSRSLGGVGMGIYQIALTVFASLLTFSSSGIPVTVSRLMTKYNAQNKKQYIPSVVSAGIFTAFFTSVLTIVVFLCFKKTIFPKLFTDDRCMKALVIILPTLVLSSVYNVLRGILWGERNFLPYSIIDLAEEIIMIVIGIVLITNSTTLLSAIKGASKAVMISYCCSFLMMTFYFIFKRTKLSSPFPQLKPLIVSSTPITVMKAVGSLVGSFVAVLFPMMMVKAGATNSTAVAEYGSTFGMAMPLLSIPSTLIGSFIVVLIPEVAENFYSKNYTALKNNVENSMEISILVTSVFIPIFTVLGEEIGVFLYGDYLCGKFLSVSAIMTLPMGISMVATGILNSIGEEKKTLLYFLLTSLSLIVCTVTLTGVIGVYSLLVGYIITYTVTAILSLKLIYKKIKERPAFIKSSLKILFCIVPTTIFGYFLNRLLQRTFSNALSMFIGCFAMLLFNCVLIYCVKPQSVITKLKLAKR